MKKSLILLIVSSSLFLNSCIFDVRTDEDVFNLIVEEKSYDEVYAFSSDIALENYLVSYPFNNNPYAKIYTIYGSIDNVDTFYVYGLDDWGNIFEPFIYEWPLKHSYDDCLELFKNNISTKTFNKTRDDGISFITNKYFLDNVFIKNNINLSSNFVLKCDFSYYVYEVDGNLSFSYIEN